MAKYGHRQCTEIGIRLQCSWHAQACAILTAYKFMQKTVCKCSTTGKPEVSQIANPWSKVSVCKSIAVIRGQLQSGHRTRIKVLFHKSLEPARSLGTRRGSSALCQNTGLGEQCEQLNEAVQSSELWAIRTSCVYCLIQGTDFSVKVLIATTQFFYLYWILSTHLFTYQPIYLSMCGGPPAQFLCTLTADVKHHKSREDYEV